MELTTQLGGSKGKRLKNRHQKNKIKRIIEP
jgi:hypothetical protein